jgi:hypothetical protein
LKGSNGPLFFYLTDIGLLKNKKREPFTGKASNKINWHLYVNPIDKRAFNALTLSIHVQFKMGRGDAGKKKRIKVRKALSELKWDDWLDFLTQLDDSVEIHQVRQASGFSFLANAGQASSGAEKRAAIAKELRRSPKRYESYYESYYESCS